MKEALLMSHLFMFVGLDFLVPTTFLCVSRLVKSFICSRISDMYVYGWWRCAIFMCPFNFLVNSKQGSSPAEGIHVRQQLKQTTSRISTR